MTLSRRQKYLLLIAAVLAVLIVFKRMSPFVGELFSDDEQYLEQRIVALQHKQQRKVRLEKELVQLEKGLDRLEGHLVAGDTAALAAVNIQNLLYELGKQNQVEINSLLVMKTDKYDDEALDMYSRLGVQARMKVTTKQLRGILYGIMNSTTVLRVTDLQITKVRQTKTQDKAAPLLSVTFTVRGPMLNK